jgi:hypothetical protein
MTNCEAYDSYIYIFCINQQSQYSVFHKPMCCHSLTFRLPNVISPLQQISYTVLQVGWGP